MRKLLLSEEVLCLVTDRARAATIAGDLTEEAAVRGPLWFVAALAGVLLAMFFAAFSAARRHTLGLLVKGFVVWSLIYAGVRVAGALSGLQPAFTTGTEFAALPLAAQLYLAAALIVAGLGAGAILGGSARANGVNAAVPLAMLWLSVGVVASVWDVAAGSATWYCTFLYLVGLPLCYALPLLGGAAFTGRYGSTAGQEASG